MKRLSVLSLMAVGLGLIFLHSCQKEPGHKSGSEIQIISDDDAMAQQIISFKERCAFLLGNPGLKTEGSISVDTAVFFIEAFMNLTYGNNDSASELVQKESNIVIHVDENKMINNLEVAQLYEKVEDTMNMHLQSIGWQNKIIILVDLESFEDLNGVFLSLTTLIGNTTFTGLPNKSWKFGELRGSCDGYYEGEKDAATELQKIVHQLVWDEPPAGKFYYYTNVTRHDYFDPTLYQIDPTPDNYEDYLIYYANDNIHPLDATTECLEKEDEFPYYRDNYVDFCEALETGTIKYQRSLFTGVDLGDIWQHKLSIWVGRRWISYHE